LIELKILIAQCNQIFIIVSCFVDMPLNNLCDTCTLTDVPCNHRNGLREPAAHPDHGSLPSIIPSGVEQLALLADGSVWMPSHINTWEKYM